LRLKTQKVPFKLRSTIQAIPQKKKSRHNLFTVHVYVRTVLLP